MYCNSFFITNKHTIFHYNKLKLQQNYINTKRYTRLKFKGYKLLKLRKSNQKQNKKKTKETHTKQTKTKGQRERETERERKKFTHPIFLNDFSYVVYLFLHKNLLSTIHLRHWNYVICLMQFFSKSNCFLCVISSNFFFYPFNFSDFRSEIIYIYEFLFSGFIDV